MYLRIVYFACAIAYAIAHAIFKHYFFLLLFGPPTAPLASYLGLL